jgi:glycosyltransferase involved in cell wall biosynthesis
MIENRQTLIILTPGFPVNEQDSTCLPSQQLFIRAINKIFPRINLVILSFEYPFSKSEYLWNHNRVIPFGGKNKRGLFRFRMWINVWRKLKKIYKQEEIVGILSFWCTETAFIGKSFAKKFNLKHYCWILGQDARKGNKMIKLIRPKSSELIAMSDFLANEFFSNYKIHPLHIIPNGIEPDLFLQNNCGRDVDIAGAGSLIPLKRYDVFIGAFNQIAKAIPSAKGMLCGKGTEEEHLIALTSKFNLQDNITLTGEVPHDEVLKIMQRSKVFLHTSSYEGFSGVCLEALYAGAQVISFCNPVNQKIDHWHIVSTSDEMVDKAIELLSSSTTSYTPVLAFDMNSSAKEIMHLFF